MVGVYVHAFTLSLCMQLVKDERPQQDISDHQSDEKEEYHSFKSQNSLHQVGSKIYIETTYIKRNTLFSDRII